MGFIDADAAIARLSRSQHGAWSRRQALDAGMTARRIQGHLGRGDWVQLDSGVYAHLAAPATWKRSVMAAVLAEPWAVASHKSAACLHELTGFRPGRPEITVRPGANARGRLAHVHRGIDVRTTTVDGIPCVSLDQVFVDLAQVVGEPRLRGALGARADRDHHLLDAVRDRYCALAPKGGRNLRTLRAVLERFGSGDDIQRSALEARLASVLAHPSIPGVQFEAAFPGREPGLQRVDALIAEWKLVVEGDGRAWHARIEDFERDRRRDAEAAAAGFLTLRFTWHQLTTDPSWVREIVVRTGRERAPTEVGGTGGPPWSQPAPNLRSA